MTKGLSADNIENNEAEERNASSRTSPSAETYIINRNKYEQ